ncbi:Hypothetical predicted protein, partial [Pelobates cultripes]
ALDEHCDMRALGDCRVDRAKKCAGHLKGGRDTLSCTRLVRDSFSICCWNRPWLSGHLLSKYVQVDGIEKCCGQCVKHSCIVKTSSGETKLLTAGELWYPSDDICTSYTCSKSDGPYSALENRSPSYCIMCNKQEHKTSGMLLGQEFQKSDNQCCGKCVQIACVVTTEEGTSKLLTGTIELSPDGCCNVCKAPRTCGLMLNNTVISVDGCTIQAEIPYCSGVCSISQ